MIQYVFVDSRNASSGSSNSYVLHLTHRIKNIERVDLVSAKVPNTMYNITNGSITISGNTISVPSGFYSAYGLETVLPIQYIPDQGIFSFNNPGTINSASPDVQKCLGLTSLPLTTPATSQTLIDLSTNDFVFLDIDELKTTATIDSKTITSGDTYKGSTIAGTFGMIPMDVASGQIKTFKEHTDYSYSILYKNLPSIDRLTVRWLDLNGNLLNFNGFNNNSFILRITTSDPKEEEPKPMMVQQRREELPAVQKEKTRWGKWVVLLGVLAFLGLLYLQKKPSLPASSSTSLSR
jgi:hypothetical protein